MVHKGANYGYSEREGTDVLQGPDNTMAKLPVVDEIPVRISDTVANGTIVPTYPVIEYPQTVAGGDAIAGGFVYRGKALPDLRGKYIFGDISTGRIWYADYKEMLAADDTNPASLAALHDVHLKWNPPGEAAGRVYPSAFPVVLAAYKARGGVDPDLPGQSTVSGPGRADVRFAVDADGELYLLSKVDGMIRAVVSATK